MQTLCFLDFLISMSIYHALRNLLPLYTPAQKIRWLNMTRSIIVNGVKKQSL